MSRRERIVRRFINSRTLCGIGNRKKNFSAAIRTHANWALTSDCRYPHATKFVTEFEIYDDEQKAFESCE